MRSRVWVAMVCPRVRLSLGARRWTTAGKKPSIFEKLWAAMFGVTLCCLLVKEASSRAIKRPKIDTMRALSLRRGGMVITGVFRGRKLEVMTRPAIMLPQARRLMGLMMEGLFSLMGDRGRKRGWPIETR